jgi:3-hydroxyisobutyrate dehydrogenase-like beta-hydroxyacid dehydrogenase
MSTILPSSVCQLDQHARKKNARVIDGPLSGGPDGPATGNLMLMVGTEAEDFSVAIRALDGMRDRPVHCGGMGSGATTKVVNNLIGVTNWLLMAEAMALLNSLGMDLDTLGNFYKPVLTVP